MFFLVNQGNVETIETIIKSVEYDRRKELLNSLDGAGNTILQSAVLKSDISIFKSLMNYYTLFDIKQQNNDGQTALSLALKIPNTPHEIVARLTALEIMSKSNHENTHKRRKKATDPSIPILRKALQSSDLTKVKRLIKNGADINEMDKRGLTSLHSFAKDLVQMAVHENTVWDLFSFGYIELFRYLLNETEADASIRTRESNQDVLELVLSEAFRYHNYRKSFYHDIALIVEPLMLKWQMVDNCMYVCVFRAFFVGIKGNSWSLVKQCLDKFYTKEHNSKYFPLVDQIVRLFNLNEHKERYILCILLHEQYGNVAQDLGFLREQLDCGQPLMHEQLLALCRTLARTSYKFDERLCIFIELLINLKNQGYHLERTNVVESLSIGFVNELIPKERAQRIFVLLSAIFEHFNISFNNILISVLERIPNFMWHILKHTYTDLKPIQLLLPFCTNIFYSVSTLFYTVLYNESFSIEISCNPSLLTLNEHQKLVYIEEDQCHYLTPMSLLELSRNKIRRELHRESRTNKEFIEKITSLPVPELIQKYLRYIKNF